MNFIRSSIFTIFFFAWSLVVFLILIPVLLGKPKHVMWSAKTWAWGVVKAARFIMGIKWKITGTENLPADGRYFIASKHQSAFETIVFYLVCDMACYVLKKELILIPIFGWYIRRIHSIEVDRSGGASALRLLVKQSKERIASGRQVIVFPEGTRMKPGAKGKYQAGIAAMYAACDVPVVPVALDAGKCWPKNSWIKHSGTITFAFLPPIAPGLKRAEFMKTLEERIEQGCAELKKTTK